MPGSQKAPTVESPETAARRGSRRQSGVVMGGPTKRQQSGVSGLTGASSRRGSGGIISEDRRLQLEKEHNEKKRRQSRLQTDTMTLSTGLKTATGKVGTEAVGDFGSDSEEDN